MILFCDTSALVKLYVVEAGSQAMKGLVEEAEAVAVCRIAWTEARAAFSRRAREIPEDGELLEKAKIALSSDWPLFVVMEVTQALVERAGEYADIFGLRAYDAVQLAGAFETGRISGVPIVFASFDARLNKAARLLGMECRSTTPS